MNWKLEKSFTMKSQEQKSEHSLLSPVLISLQWVWKKRYLNNITFNGTFGYLIQMIKNDSYSTLLSVYGTKELKYFWISLDI